MGYKQGNVTIVYLYYIFCSSAYAVKFEQAASKL